MAIKAVIFDIDGVLIDSIKANAIFFENLFKNIAGAKYSRKEYIKRNYMTMWDIIKYFTKERSDQRIREIWKLALKSRYTHEHIKLPKDGVAVLRTLSRNYKLAVVTARQTAGVRPILRRYGYIKYIKTMVSFKDYKHPKPHPEPLLVALKKLKVKAKEAVYVGDMESDILCAKSAGVRSILYKRPYSILKKSKPDYTVKSFKQLSALVNKL